MPVSFLSRYSWRFLKPTASFVIAVALVATGCSKTQTAQASNRENTAKEVAITAVKKDAVRRSVDVIGTLAAVDQVVISSEADGSVRTILADLGDRVKAGQVLIQLDNEKQQYSFEQQQAALARALAQYGAPDPQHLPEIEQTPDVQKANADLVQAQRAFDRANELFKRTLVPQQTLDEARTALESSQGELQLVAARREKPAREHPGIGSVDEACRPKPARHGNPRAV